MEKFLPKNSYKLHILMVWVLIDFKPIKFVAIGLTAFADVNIKRSVYGITAILSLGKLR